MFWAIYMTLNFEEFHRNFGPKVKNLRFYRQFINLNLFPNIEKVEFKLTNYNDDLSFATSIPQLELANLKQLESELYPGQEHLFQTFIDKFPTLTHFKVTFYSDDENAIYKPLKNISKLKHLIHFQFMNERVENDYRFCALLKQMANICKNLKRIDFNFNINQSSNIRQMLSHFKAFPALKRLKLWFRFVNYEDEDNIDVNQLFSFELFKGFENITHLTLCFILRQTLKESIFKEIDINLPKLQYLEIKYHTFDTTPEGVTQMADILSRLSRLETLKLKFKSGVDLKPIEEQITEKCRKIRKIKIKNI